ncbi:Glycosyltransferase involved in cell wall bisynthesis [Singulisphaera sp. GP187]|nr:Glycosyltransferase involved in cell wall bisynthesis [Singulisphaera sp. GP187]
MFASLLQTITYSAFRITIQSAMHPNLRYCAVIPVYNGADTIAHAIESVLAQTNPPDEVVVVDDGSDDDSAIVASRYSSSVHVVRQPNAGPGAARNRGVRDSSAEWVAFLDADDTWLPEKMERQMALLGDSRVGVVHARGTLSPSPAPPIVTFENLWAENCIRLSSTIVRRTAWESVGGFDESPGLISVEDHNLWLRLAVAGWTIVTCPEDLIQYNQATGGLSYRTESFARAEFTNYDKIGELLKLEREVVRSKILKLHVKHGRSLLHRREMSSARRLLGVPLRESPCRETLRLWLATFVPARLLDLRRNFRELSRGTELPSRSS